MAKENIQVIEVQRSTASSCPTEPSGWHEGCVRVLDLKHGVTARLCTDRAHGLASGRLADLGFVPGTPLRIIRRAPLGDPIEIEIRGTRICVRRKELDELYSIPEDGP